MINDWLHRRDTLSSGACESLVDASLPGWAHTGLRILELADATVDLPAEAVERVLVPLSGPTFTVKYSAPEGIVGEQNLAGRRSVFHGPADCLYLPTGTAATVRGSGRIAVCEAPTEETRPVQYLPAADVPVELRGAGRSSRQVHNFATPAGLDCVKIIACEVITPAENWSSYPPHKHDEAIAGTETRLEEIYYFESAVSRGLTAPAAADPFALFATYSSAAGEIETSAIVRTGDIALVPYGYHGPVAAAPGYDNYYLNVMAGPDPDRAWLITDDPAHGWVREQWEGEEFDPRLPYTAEPTGDEDTTGTQNAAAPGRDGFTTEDGGERR
ncbi:MULTISPECIES: 5-deoxy-glucuronate isomerase [Brevibacterium]|uniref:5-deoxy-glucuronate isomerase n=3 Tax=Bacteria TaxID=2 RepID=K9AG91_9MICO|nr:5-deoxy-glucuronate isomerase [Brevibacterium casei]NJE67450.1 5-deoxy-glucuronate isomerase [Brevibacterium sp. LS14]EKU45141.1 hypothetical protein C272_15732 [Brevibacterium casei S18]MBE4694198.1 5-deoxy-glucuronate isomerase [Brevibacterium casei]MBY3577321.1 5-deoxy-glucuronate isomerase [Brevibacterium casei]MCT1446092.1 5-deoxy-glucuronate isomerase [Brevibacterium casei]